MAKQFYIAANEDTWNTLRALAEQTDSYPERGPKAGTGEASVMTLVRRIAASPECVEAIREILSDGE